MYFFQCQTKLGALGKYIKHRMRIDSEEHQSSSVDCSTILIL